MTYTEALAEAAKTGADHATDASLMALFCKGPLQTLVGAVSPQLVWEGAQKKGLTTSELGTLCLGDVMVVSDLQWL